jgi:hypothetical protein
MEKAMMLHWTSGSWSPARLLIAFALDVMAINRFAPDCQQPAERDPRRHIDWEGAE